MELVELNSIFVSLYFYNLLQSLTFYHAFFQMMQMIQKRTMLHGKIG
jgi:hypothetical protein